MKTFQKQTIIDRLMTVLIPAFMLLSILWTGISLASAAQIITFPSADNLLLTADSYALHAANTTPVVVLFHQAGSSRGEYDDIAPKLNDLGFNCIAVDLRSGEFSRGKDNETAIRASKAGLASRYVDALPDIIAALQFAHKQYPDSKVIAWGSSYSASLVLKVAGDHPQLADAVLAFSPGEYFSHLGKSKTWIRESAQNIRVPVFITSSKDEAESWDSIYQVIPSSTKMRFIPSTPGNHGSRALWEKYADSTAYWGAVTGFLDKLKQP
jgi:pimeloyl-ACP methyl ester carboxylesterase